MSKKKIRDLTTLSAADDLDLLAIVDVDEPILENQTKKITVGTLLGGLGAGFTSPLTTSGDIFVHDGSGDVRLPVGQDGQLLSANSASIDGTGLEWINAPIGGDEPYVEINHTGTLPNVQGLNTIAIGQGTASISTSSDVILIGDSVVTTGTTTNHCIAVGSNITLFNKASSVIIGDDAQLIGSNATVVGRNAVAGLGSVGLGYFANANSSDSIAIGAATASGNETIVIGTGSAVSNASSIGNTLIGISNFVEGYGGTTSYAITIGYAAGVEQDEAIAIGKNSFINGLSSVGLGANTTTEADNAVAIGDTASCGTDSTGGVAIGFSAAVGNSDPGAIAIGNNPSAFSENSIAIGTNAIASGGLDVIALGARNNITSVGSFAFGTDNVISAGTATVHTNSSSCITVGDDNIINDCAQTYIFGDNNTATGLNDAVIIGENNVMTGGVSLTPGQSNMYNNIQLGHQNTITDTTNASIIGNRIQIGLQNINNGTSSYQTIQLGSSTTIGNNSEFSIAIGTDSAIADNAPGAVQLGTGTNSAADTLQYLTNTIATSNGVVVPYQTTGAAPTSTPANGTLVLDNNGTTTTLWARANGAWVSLISV